MIEPHPTQMGQLNAFADVAYAAYAEVGRRGFIYPSWTLTPSVDRGTVKIREFHYFGHSGNSDIQGEDALFIEYGVSNAKGTLSTSEVEISESQLVAELSPSLFSVDATATLWGCFTGRTMAPALTPLFSSVTACEGLTTFAFILDNGENLPEPVNPALPFNTYVEQ